MLKPFYNKKYKLNMTAPELESAFAKAALLPSLSSADASKVLMVSDDGTIIAGEAAGGDDAIDELIDGSISIYTGSVTRIRAQAFLNCQSLTTVNAPNCETIAASAFNGCSNLETLTADNCSLVMHDAFRGCQKLTELSLPGISKLYGSDFYQADYLSVLYLPNLATISGSGTFARATRLTSLYLLSSSVVNFGAGYGLSNHFSSTPILSGTGSIYVPSSLLTAYQNDSRWSTFSSQFVGV